MRHAKDRAYAVSISQSLNWARSVVRIDDVVSSEISAALTRLTPMQPKSGEAEPFFPGLQFSRPFQLLPGSC